MIFLENNSSKTISLFILVVVTGLFVFWGWIKINPLSRAGDQADNQYWSDLLEAADQTSTEVGNNWQVAGEELENMQAEFERQAKADALFDATKNYIQNTSTVTSTSL